MLLLLLLLLLLMEGKVILVMYLDAGPSWCIDGGLVSSSIEG
jgi:hypothetical protein